MVLNFRKFSRLSASGPLFRYMKLGHRLLLAIYAGFFLNSLLVFIWGDAGLKQMNALIDHRDNLVHNIEKLEYINNELSLELDALLYDEMEIELRARALGYYRKNVVQVLLSGYRERGGSRTLGTLIRPIPTPAGNRIAFRVVFLCVFVAALAGTFLWRRHGRDSRLR